MQQLLEANIECIQLQLCKQGINKFYGRKLRGYPSKNL